MNFIQLTLSTSRVAVYINPALVTFIHARQQNEVHIHFDKDNAVAVSETIEQVRALLTGAAPPSGSSDVIMTAAIGMMTSPG